MIRRRTSVASAVAVVVALTAGIATPARASTERYGRAQGLEADVTYKLTNLHVAYGPDPTASVGPSPATDIKGVVNLDVFAGFGSFEAESILASANGNFGDHAESSALASNFNFLDFRGDQIVSECSASMTGATGKTTLTDVLALGGEPLPDNPAPNTVLDFTPSFTVHLNEQHVTTAASGTRIEVTAMRVVFLRASDYTGSFSFGRVVCQFGAVGVGGGGPVEEPVEGPVASPGAPPDSPSQPGAVVEPKFTG